MIIPNQPMSWHSLMLVYAGIAGVTLAVGGFYYLAGLTLILPFSGLEVLALGAAFYITAWRGGAREVITISRNSIAVEAGRHEPGIRHKFQRQWSKVILEYSWNGWYASKLLLRSHGKEIEIGKFLNEQERRGFAIVLSNAIRGAA